MIFSTIEEKVEASLPFFHIQASFRKFVKHNKHMNNLYSLAKKNNRFSAYFNRSIIKAFAWFYQINVKAYRIRLNVIRKFLQANRSMYKTFVSTPNKHLPNMPNKRNEYLNKIYGKVAYHLDSVYLENKCTKKYVNYNFLNNMNTSQILINTNTINYLPSLSQDDNFNEDSLCKRPCDMNCIIPHNWGLRCFESLKKLQPKKALSSLIDEYLLFETCTLCNGDYNTCVGEIKCQDNLQFLNKMAVHFPKVRLMVRKFYYCRNLINQYHSINHALGFGLVTKLDIHHAKKLQPNNQSHKLDSSLMNNDDNDSSVVKPTINYQLYNKLFQEFCKDLKMRLQLQACESCCKLFKPTDLTPIKANEVTQNKDILKKLFGTNINASGLPICRNFCHKDLFILQRVPIYSHLNNMYLEATPEEIKCLNIYEKQLISLARVYQSIVKLSTKSKLSVFRGIPALKGIAIHLPLTLDATNQYIQDTLPNYNHLKIIIDSMPTKNSVVWRTLVNLDKVYSAISLLTKINHYYLKTKILPQNNISLYKMIKFVKPNVEDQSKVDHDPYVQLSSNIFNPRQYTVIDLDKVNTNDTDCNKYLSKKNIQKPLSNNDVHLDHLCFPELFPRGVGGMFDERQYEVKPAMYLRHILMNRNPIARRNQQYVFSALHNKDVRASESGIFTQMNVMAGKQFTASEFLGKVKINDDELEPNLHTVMNKVRNSKQYWNQVSSDLRAFNQARGPAHIFLTLNPAEYNWMDLKEFLVVHCKDLPNIDTIQFNDLLNIEPGLVAYYFNQRFNSFFAKVLFAHNGPIGKVTGYFWRREYQSRGAPHMHIKLWINGAPIIGVDKEEDVINFIDNHITCALPDPIKEPILYDLVIRFQIHHCTESCIRHRFTGHCKTKYCRYGYPRQPQLTTTLNSVEDTLRSRKKCLGKKIYNLKRKPNECYVNDYNPIILLIWAANMDIQFIGEYTMALDKYITGYITKPERNATKELWEQSSKDSSLRSQLKSFSLKCLKSREAGIYEAFDKILGFQMCEFSTKVTWVNTFEPEKRRKMVLPKHELEKLAGGSTKIFRSNSSDDYYPNRPDELEHTSFFEFISQYDIKSEKCSANHKKCFKLKSDPITNKPIGFIHRRSEDKIINTMTIKVSDQNSSEAYFRQLLFLFKPWREEHTLISKFQSYYEAYQDIQEQAMLDPNLFDMDRHDKYQFVRQRTAKASLIAERIRSEKNDTNFGHRNHANQKEVGVTDFILSKVDPQKLELKIKSLNNEQKRIFDKIIANIEHIEAHKNKKCHCHLIPKPIRMFCSGVAGNIIKSKLNFVL